MKKRAAVGARKQEGAGMTMGVATQQLMLPLLIAMDATKKGLLAFVQQMGMVALSELLAMEAAQVAGPKGKHNEGRTHNPVSYTHLDVYKRQAQSLSPGGSAHHEP